LNFTISDGQQRLQFSPAPSSDDYKVLRTESLGAPFAEDLSGTLAGFTWSAPFRTDSLGFYTVKPTPMAKDDLLTSVVLSRLAYGPTPDELERVKAMGADAYIQEQLAPEKIAENLAIDVPPKPVGPDWQFISATGTASSSLLYIYLDSVGEGYLDDIRLVEGVVPGAGVNLLRNGDFEKPLVAADWTVSPNLSGSSMVTDVKKSGNASLKLVATEPGTTQASAIWQTITPALPTAKTYTISFWFLPSGTTARKPNITVRLSGSGIVASLGGSTPFERLVNDAATISDLRNWHVLHAVESKKQLLEVLLQFLDNHFVTEYTKSRDHFSAFYKDTQQSQEAVNLEFREIQRWRTALLNPQCTFYDLLKISAESPAMIIYLDTVTSAGQPGNTANENYARELLELFTFGVDNGYDQADIVETSKTWSGWRVAMFNPQDELNPLATPLFHPSNAPKEATNHVGVWSFWYRPDRHNNAAKIIFGGKTVPDRFGPPYAGRPYALSLPARSSTSGMQDGYDVIRHLADQPFTQEFISVKLCRLFIHDDFLHGVYDYSDPAGLSPEGKLVRQCMEAWENGSPKGQLRAVLSTIFNSELFRTTAAAQQKVKTPLEFTVSAIRSMRSETAGTFTAETDGDLASALNRMGSMNLFDRAEPDGYPEAAAPWISAGTLAERLRFVQAFLTAKGTGGRPTDAGNSFCDPVALLKTKLPQSDWNNAGAVAGYFVHLIFPGEGRANLENYRQNAAYFLNTANSGTAASSFATISTTGSPSPYDIRVRGMVAMLMTLPRFQEQ
jgi:uncharacterized protein (DUF1800 family)